MANDNILTEGKTLIDSMIQFSLFVKSSHKKKKNIYIYIYIYICIFLYYIHVEKEKILKDT